MLCMMEGMTAKYLKALHMGSMFKEFTKHGNIFFKWFNPDFAFHQTNLCSLDVNAYTPLHLLLFIAYNEKKMPCCMFFIMLGIIFSWQKAWFDSIKATWPAPHPKIFSYNKLKKELHSGRKWLIFCAMIRHSCQSSTKLRKHIYASKKQVPLDLRTWKGKAMEMIKRVDLLALSFFFVLTLYWTEH